MSTKPVSRIDEIPIALQTKIEKRVCCTLWETFNKLLEELKVPPVDIIDHIVEDAFIELQERLEEVLPFRSDEV